jgi:hypothetical protein
MARRPPRSELAARGGESARRAVHRNEQRGGETMNRAPIRTWRLVLAAIFACAVPSVAAATTATGPYYAKPSWDQQLPASTRFVVLSNWVDANYPSGGAAVLDRETGLVWQRGPFSGDLGFSWSAASSSCASNAYGGRFGWRLPTVQEMGSLLDPNATSGPALPVGNPFIGVPAAAIYWTATSDDADANSAYAVAWGIPQNPTPPRFTILPFLRLAKSTGVFGIFITTETPVQFWCVRGGLQPVPQ